MKTNYEKMAQFYEQTRDIDPFIYLTVSFLLELNQEDTLLDFGCGTGNYLKQFFKNYKMKVYGIEPSDSMRKIAQNKVYTKNIHKGNHKYLPFEDEKFNKIYCIDVIHHIRSLDLFFQNLLRVAAPNAKFCICTESFSQLKEKYWIKYFPNILTIDFCRFHLIEDIVKIGEQNGWTYYKTLSIENKIVAPISSHFMECVYKKTLSVFQFISNEEYEEGLYLMKKDYEEQLLITQNEGYTFITFNKQ